MNFSRPGGTYAGANDDLALKRRAIVGVSLPGRAKTDGLHPQGGAEGNSFPEFSLGWTIGAMRLAKNKFCRIIKTMSEQEMLIEEIKRQPEPVVREILHYLKFLERQREKEAPMDSLVADTWEKLGPAPEVDYDQL